ncbi:hypothetical protein KDN34_04540 [Shewanella yunxiaonensis]|uniref:Lipoprotein n=1 Tax=Shewanella yunxiaonensis TaxID=2829809 RepID=A0ABX7YV80_9GAMM|nr:MULTISPECIES: hypothetical protein [Shewanella]MDF0532840.1 hypothetical protein [Shewanella sp. A32]QUN06722.1 hypothetical protein KDN34_04540 [Shewanella yunxiaonensis]
MKMAVAFISLILVEGCSWNPLEVGAEVSPHGTSVTVKGKAKGGDIDVSDIPKTEHPIQQN